jgi:hypothetical protein
MTSKISYFPGSSVSEKDFESGKVLYHYDKLQTTYRWDTGIAIGKYLQGLKQGIILGTSCSHCRKIVVPPRLICSDCFKPMEGYLQLEVKNIGHENGKNAIIKIVRNDMSPILPVSGSMFIGDFSVDQVVSGRFKVSISSDAEEQTYPLDVMVNYENSEGDTISSDVETVGLRVGKKIDFNIVSEPEKVSPGQKKVINVRYTNTGGAPAYNVQARISAVDPFTSNDDTAFLGTLAPGETRDAAFEITIDKTATLKEYALDSEVRYRDALDNSLISDPMKVRILVEKENSILSNPFILAGGIAVIILIGYLVYRQRSNKH